MREKKKRNNKIYGTNTDVNKMFKARCSDLQNENKISVPAINGKEMIYYSEHTYLILVHKRL